MKVFLGGTCNNSAWRANLITMIQMNYFDPVVDDWTPECMEEEIRQRDICDYVLYVITPRMTGTYSIAEAVDDSNKRPDKTLFCSLMHDPSNTEVMTFNEFQLRSLHQVGEMVKSNGGKYFTTLTDVAAFLNGKVQ